MPIDGRSTAIKIAAAAFFCVGMIGWMRGVQPDMCCKRALIGAFVAYVATVLAVKATNAVLVSAIIKNEIFEQEGQGNDASD